MSLPPVVSDLRRCYHREQLADECPGPEGLPHVWALLDGYPPNLERLFEVCRSCGGRRP